MKQNWCLAFEIYKLFDRAVEDYISIDLWLEYCQFSLGGIATEKGIENARNVCERAVNAVGIHVARGSLIWEVFREFENAILSIFKDTEKEQEQRNRIDRLFKRQLALPLLGKQHYDLSWIFLSVPSWEIMWGRGLVSISKVPNIDFKHIEQAVFDSSKKQAGGPTKSADQSTKNRHIWWVSRLASYCRRKVLVQSF